MEDWIFFIIAVGFYIVSGLVRRMADAAPPENQKNPNRPKPLRPAQVAKEERHASAHRDLESFLDELGVRREEAAVEKRPARRPPPIPKAPKRETPKPRKSTGVEGRRLTSSLEARHAESLHTALEEKHLLPHVADTEPPAVGVSAKPRQVETRSNLLIKGMIGTRSRVGWALMLGQVLDTPAGLRDDKLGIGRPRGF